MSTDPHASHALHGGATLTDAQIFCANCQAVTTHKLSAEGVEHVMRINQSARSTNPDHVDRQPELIATCDCGRALKFPMCDRAELQAHFDRHHASNVGQISAESVSVAQTEHDARFKKLMGIA